jgi:hypothetical protein
LSQGVVGGENNALLGIAQGVVEIKQDGFEHGGSPFGFLGRFCWGKLFGKKFSPSPFQKLYKNGGIDL